MKHIYLKTFSLLFFSFVLVCTRSEAKNYYISATGSNTNTGLSPATPWQNIAKLNSSFSIILPGDSILFKSGQTFTGSIMVNKSGTTSSPIVIGSYGTGAKPIISGLTTLSGWSNVSGNIWQCSISTLKANVNVLTIDGVPQAVGRTNWMVYQSASAAQLTSSSLSGSPSYVGAEIVIRKGVFVAERGLVTAQSGTTVSYTDNVPKIHNGKSASFVAGRSKYSFFLQRFAGSLDKFGEWYYNASTDKMMIYSVTSPSAYSIKASYVDTIINLNKQTNITITNLSLEGAGIFAIESYGGTNVTIKNCSFDNNTKAIYVWNTNDVTIDKNTINNSFNNAILVSNNQAKRINVTNNVVTNTGQLFGMGIFNHEYSLRGIVARTDTTRASNYVNIIGNKVINSGNAAIQFQGSNVLVRRNVTDTFCNQMDDNGGIYTFINNQSVNKEMYTNRLVDSNFISNAIGAPESANGGVDVTGLYMDDQTSNVVAKHNTIWNIPGNGIQLNNPLNMTITDNTVYNCSYLVWVNKKPYGDISGTVVSNNVLYQKDSTQYNFSYTNANLSSPAMTLTQAIGAVTVDNNWISNLKTAGYYYYYSTTGSSYTFPPKLTLAQWKNTYSHDKNSILTAVKPTPTNTRIEFNTTPDAVTVSFSGKSYMDAKGTVYNNAATIPAWSSLVLISNGTAASVNVAPVASAPDSIVITLPVNAATLTGKGTDKDGTIASYSWTKISGPASANIASANAASTVVNALTKGIYTFEFMVKDDKGAIGKDTTVVIVNAALNSAPTADAGTAITITLPTNTTSLSGKGTDQDGTISSYAWVKIAGPAAGTIGTPNAATTVINNLVQGVYQYELTVTDNSGATAKDTIQVTVNEAPHQAPVVNAGGDIAINAPANKVTLTGTVMFNGSAGTYTWAKISGPVSGKIAMADSTTTLVSKLSEGVYQFELTVTDDLGTIAKDTVQVTVSGSIKQAPLARGGVKTFTTTNSITLLGRNLTNTVSLSDTLQVSLKAPAIDNHIPAGTHLTIYPNPARDITNLDITTVGKSVLNISVTDMSGRIVKYNGSVSLDRKGSIKLDMASLRDGYYIITVRFDNGEVISSRIIKQAGK